MRKHGLLNAPLARVVAEMGHTDTLAIADAGLPIPPGTPRIDLAVRPGLPGFVDVLEAVLDELCVERALLATEIKTASPHLHDVTTERLAGAVAGTDTEPHIDYVDHDVFKVRVAGARAVVRTGECTPFANVLLTSGVPF